MQLYYFETTDGRYISAPDYNSCQVCILFENAKFFSNKKSAKMWYDRYEDLMGIEVVLYSFEAINFMKVD